LYIDNRKLLIERLKSRDLDPELVKSVDECAQIDAQQAAAQAQKSQMEDTVNQAKAQSLQAKAGKDSADAQATQEQNQAQISKILAEVQAKLADTSLKKGKLDLEHLQTLMQDLRERSQGAAQQNNVKERKNVSTGTRA
jgi:hypothetical protein